MTSLFRFYCEDEADDGDVNRDDVGSEDGGDEDAEENRDNNNNGGEQKARRGRVMVVSRLQAKLSPGNFDPDA